MTKFLNLCFCLGLVSLLNSSVLSQTISKKITINKDLQLVPLTPNTYIHISYAQFTGYGRVECNGMILTDGDKAFLFDTPPTELLTRTLVNWITRTLKLRIVGFMPNHWHSDCMAGLAYLQSIGVKSYANQMTIEIARIKNLPVPTTGFKDSLNLELGNTLISCYFLGAGHSMDNIVVWIPSQKILFAGCLVKEISSKGMGNTADGDLKQYPETIDKVLHKFGDAKIVIPGHGAFGGIELIKHTKALLSR